MLTSLHLHMKSRRVCIKTRSPPASLPLKGQVTRHTTVKWPIHGEHWHGCVFSVLYLTWIQSLQIHWSLLFRVMFQWHFWQDPMPSFFGRKNNRDWWVESAHVHFTKPLTTANSRNCGYLWDRDLVSILARVRNRGVQEKKKRKRIYGKGIIFIYCSTDQSCFRMHKEHDHNLYFGRESCRSATLILVT